MLMIVPYFLTMTPYMELSLLFKPCRFYCMFLVFEYCYLFFLFAHAVLDLKSLHHSTSSDVFTFPDIPISPQCWYRSCLSISIQIDLSSEDSVCEC
jgi:hypothetical protein